jgi:hypothetical protein
LAPIKKVENRAYIAVVARVSKIENITSASRLASFVLRNDNGTIKVWLDSNNCKGSRINFWIHVADTKMCVINMSALNLECWNDDRTHRTVKLLMGLAALVWLWQFQVSTFLDLATVIRE